VAGNLGGLRVLVDEAGVAKLPRGVLYTACVSNHPHALKTVSFLLTRGANPNFALRAGERAGPTLACLDRIEVRGFVTRLGGWDWTDKAMPTRCVDHQPSSPT
jgi:hypothetical protein